MKRPNKNPLLFLASISKDKAPFSIASMFALSAIGQCAHMFQIFMLGGLVDALSNVKSGFLSGMFSIQEMIVIFFVSFMINPVCVTCVTLLKAWAFPAVGIECKKRTFGYLIGHSPGYFYSSFTGNLANKVSQLGGFLQSILGNLSEYFTKMIFLIIAASVLIYNELPTIYLVIFLCWIALFIPFVAILSKRGSYYAEKSQEQASIVSGQIVDSISNWETVRTFFSLAWEQKRLGKFFSGEFDAIKRMRIFYGVLSFLQYVAVAVLLGLFMYFGFSDWRDGVITAGELITIFTLCFTVMMTVRFFCDVVVRFSEEYGSAIDTLKIIVSDYDLKPGTRNLKVTKGEIEFKDVSFTYDDGIKQVFNNFNLHIKPKQKVGLVGFSGAGKTTLSRLLKRFFISNEGKVLIDGQDIADCTQSSIAKAIGEVPQYPNFFHRSVRENMQYGLDKKVSEKDIIAASKSAYCYDFIKDLKDGFDTYVGERGIKLSGGEKQRLALARLFLFNHPIVILDESTASLDSQSEICIQKSLRKLIKGKTVIAIAHRLSTLRSMDVIVVIGKNGIIEQGSHKQLLELDGTYAKMWKMQTQQFFLE